MSTPVDAAAAGLDLAALDAVADAVAAGTPGDRLELTVSRGGAERTVDIELGTRPETAP